MKHKGAIAEHSVERMNDLKRAYHECISSRKFVVMNDVFKQVVNMPSRRFWVSDIRASLVVAAMIRGDAHLDRMGRLRREMYREIYRRTISLMKKKPWLSVYEACSEVVEQPAPKFYLTPDTAKQMIYKAKKQWRVEALKKLHP